jgi:protein farnesyltransferase/geranylgeranyltransferase type-1 subunit alpha
MNLRGIILRVIKFGKSSPLITLLNNKRHHRLLLMTAISPNSPIEEINYIHDALIPDPKNYHTWAYLHWIYSHFHTLGRISDKEWKDELVWCEELLRVDGRNNSAWGWRWFLRVSRPGAEGTRNEGQDEIK